MYLHVDYRAVSSTVMVHIFFLCFNWEIRCLETRFIWNISLKKIEKENILINTCFLTQWQLNCTGTIRNAANVCCVQFSSHSTHLLAFGSADYKIHCYDLRTTRIPWCTLAGHGKAVSYVKFLDPCTIVSASTDNTLKIWDLNKTTSSGLSTNACSLTLRGHTNEKVCLQLICSISEKNCF